MAKMFYSVEETRDVLGLNEDEINGLIREGKLREFRDGPKRMFKSDQVEALRGDTGLSDSAAPISLSDTGMGSGMGSMSGGSGAGLSGAGMSGSGLSLKDDTVAGDIGLSDSGLSGTSASGSGIGMGLSGTGHNMLSGTGAGINLLGDEEATAASSDQTAVDQSIDDQINLEGIGSGSGLLDLTRESDDTSFGADTLDEIGPAGSSISAGTGAMAVSNEPIGRPVSIGPTMVVEAADPLAAAFGGMAVAGSLLAAVAAYALVCGISGVKPDLLNFAEGPQLGLILLGVGVVLAGIFAGVGFVVGKK